MVRPVRPGGGVLALALAATGAGVALRRSGSNAYSLVLGDLDPVVATIGACAVGLVALRILDHYGWFRPASHEAPMNEAAAGPAFPESR